MICDFFLSVAACKFAFAYPSLRYTSVLLGHYCLIVRRCSTMTQCVISAMRTHGTSQSRDGRTKAPTGVAKIAVVRAEGDASL